MEYALREESEKGKKNAENERCLNPYFFGICSTRQLETKLKHSLNLKVLILIFLEYALRAIKVMNNKVIKVLES